MATDKKISELPAATLPLTGTEAKELVQGGLNKQATEFDTAKLAIVPTATGGVAIQFDKPRTYGTIAVPETGNVTYNSSGAVVGMVQLLIHSLYNSTPTFGAEFVLLGDYTPSETNYIYMELLADGNILTNIRTEV